MLNKRQKIHNKLSFNPLINITPFINVLFVLLISFIILKTESINSVKINLPKSGNKQVEIINDSIKIKIDNNNDLYVNNIYTSINNLINLIDKISLKNLNKKIYIFADENINYNFIIKIASKIKDNNYNNLELIYSNDNY